MVSIKEIQRRVKIEGDYFKSVKRNWIGPEDRKVLNKKMGGPLTNNMRTQLELHQFKAEKPQNYFAYVKPDQRVVTNWTGKKLGTITHLGSEYRDNMGGVRVPVRMKAINGLTYSGTYYKSAGDYGRFKAVKQ